MIILVTIIILIRILLTILHLVVLVGKAEPLVKGNSAVAVLVNRLELVGWASLDCGRKENDNFDSENRYKS